MSKACTTCHVVVRKGFNGLDEMDDIEADLLDRAWGLSLTLVSLAKLLSKRMT